MNANASRFLSTHRRTGAFALLLAVALAVTLALPEAQTAAKKPLTVDDYTKWRSIAGQEISGDGKWVAYTLQLTNTIAAESKPVLHLLNLETNADVTVADASGGTFSADSKWIAYQVDPGAAQRARAGRSGAGGAATPPGATAAPPGVARHTARSGRRSPPPRSRPGRRPRRARRPAIPPRRVELRNLATGAVRSWQDIGTFTFSATSTPPRASGAAAPKSGAATGGRGGGAPGGLPRRGRWRRAGDCPREPRGLDVILLDLRTGRHQLLGSVGDIAFNRTGELLAYTVDAAVKDGNGLFVFDTRSGRMTPLDNDAKSYNRLAWNEEGMAIAVVRRERGREDAREATTCSSPSRTSPRR